MAPGRGKMGYIAKAMLMVVAARWWHDGAAVEMAMALLLQGLLLYRATGGYYKHG